MKFFAYKIVYLFLFSFLLLSSCKNKKPLDAFSKDGSSYLEEIRETYGSDVVFNSKISFNINNDLYYTVTRNKHISNYTMTREAKGIKYHTTYDNGFIQYYINDSLQDDRSYKRTFFNVKLDGFIYTSSIPHIFNGTDIIIDSLPSVIIRNKPYNVLYVHTKKVPDVVEDKFYLYINPETNYIEYSAQEYLMTHPEPIFKRYYNHRVIKGIVFADYYRFISKEDDTSLENLYVAFNDVTLEEIKGIVYNDIEVQLNTQK